MAILTGRFRQSRRQVGELLQELCGVSVSLETIQSLGEETSEALAAPYREVKEAVAHADMAHLGETGWKEKRQRHYLRVAVAGAVTAFLVSGSPDRKVLMELSREAFAGMLHRDRWGAYNMVDLFRRQLCWAHLKRDFQAQSERKTRAGPVGAWGSREIKPLFAIWHRYQDGEITWAEMRWELVPVRTRLGKLLRRGASCGDPMAEAFCHDLLKLWPALLTFAFIPGEEPTKNRAESALRGAVLGQKGWFGNQSDNGDCFTERILTTVGTLGQQDRNIVEHVVAAIQAHGTGHLAPPLLRRPFNCRGGLNDYHNLSWIIPSARRPFPNSSYLTASPDCRNHWH